MYAIIMKANGKRKLLKNRFQLENLARQCRDLFAKWFPDASFEVIWVPLSSPQPTKKAPPPVLVVKG